MSDSNIIPPPKPTPRPMLGRIVQVCLENGAGETVIRPAVIVRTWPGLVEGEIASYVNVQAFMDCDGTSKCNDQSPSLLWKTSVTYNPDLSHPLTWRYPVEVSGMPAVRGAI